MRRSSIFVVLGLLLALTVGSRTRSRRTLWRTLGRAAGQGAVRPGHGCDEAQPLRRGADDAADADQHVSGFGVYPRAKLAWRIRGTPRRDTALQQARSNTRISNVLPDMPEAAEAQLKWQHPL